MNPYMRLVYYYMFNRLLVKILDDDPKAYDIWINSSQWIDYDNTITKEEIVCEVIKKANQ